MPATEEGDLAETHTPAAIRKRLESAKKSSYLGDVVLGAIDGCVTTFAVVSGVSGGKLPAAVALLLGTANLFADGFSMAVSNFQRAKSERDLIENARRREERHIDRIPDGEREEIRQIFAAKGFKDPTLNETVRLITEDRNLWISTMLTEELGLPLEGPDPFRASFFTFLAFIAIGSIPLVPFVFALWFPLERIFFYSAVLTASAFFGVGLMKGAVLRRSRWSSAFWTLFAGGGAALLAYGAGVLLRGLVGGI